MGVCYTQQNIVVEVIGIEGGKKKMRNNWYNRMGETRIMDTEDQSLEIAIVTIKGRS